MENILPLHAQLRVQTYCSSYALLSHLYYRGRGTATRPRPRPGPRGQTERFPLFHFTFSSISKRIRRSFRLRLKSTQEGESASVRPSVRGVVAIVDQAAIVPGPGWDGMEGPDPRRAEGREEGGSGSAPRLQEEAGRGRTRRRTRNAFWLQP